MSNCFEGIAVSPGIAIGTARCMPHLPTIQATGTQLDEPQVLSELALFDAALTDTIAELQCVSRKVARHAGEEAAAIFHGHESILQDATLGRRVRELISDRQIPGTQAIQLLLDEYERLFARVTDPFFTERFSDLRDVFNRLSAHMSQAVGSPGAAADHPMILVVHDLMPSHVVAVRDERVIGIVTQGGGRTSHAAILARSYGIPAVSGIEGVFSVLETGDHIIVDGNAGVIWVNPGQDLTEEYATRRKDQLAVQKKITVANVDSSCTTHDGELVELLANINCVADAQDAREVGASGIGLYRSEFFYLTHPSFPSEEDEIREYENVISASPPGPVTIRTLDVGGDKTIPYMAHAPEANPFLGWRSIRLSFEYPECFLQQIRSVLVAASSAEKEVRLLFPMLTTLDELRKIRDMVQNATEDLRFRHQEAGAVRLGMMVEVPAAAIMIDSFLPLVDFVSIGSNDLVQYLTAADRDNPKVSHLCQGLSPAVLRVVGRVIEACRDGRTPISLCGEMAGSPRAFPLLLGMGLRSFSMSPAFIPMIRQAAARISLDESQQLLHEAMQETCTASIHELVDQFLLDRCPEVASYLLA